MSKLIAKEYKRFEDIKYGGLDVMIFTLEEGQKLEEKIKNAELGNGTVF